jgi:acetyltransferase
MKVISPQILHRSDGGLVRLGIASPEQGAACYRDLVGRASSLYPDASLRGVLVQEMVHGRFEVLAGISHDPQFGPAVLFGSGGITAELLDDAALRLCPLSREDCYQMIGATNAGKLLSGFRGGPEGDIDALVDVLMALSDLACGLDGLVKEMDINPLVVREKGRGVVAVDVRLVAASGLAKDAI